MTITLKKRELVAANSIEVTFERTEGVMEFVPGQFVSVTIPGISNPDQRGNQRFFSITTLPGSPEFSIVTRLSDSSYKQALASLPLGTEARLDMVAGSFVLPPAVDRPLVFIAGGIGITPFMSMLRHVRLHRLSYDITLLYSNRNRQSTAFLDELIALKDTNDRFSLIATMTDDPGWNGPTSVIDGTFISAHAPRWQDASFYIAGPPQMVDQVVETVRTLGVAEDAVKYEQFAGYASVAQGTA